MSLDLPHFFILPRSGSISLPGFLTGDHGRPGHLGFALRDIPSFSESWTCLLGDFVPRTSTALLVPRVLHPAEPQDQCSKKLVLPTPSKDADTMNEWPLQACEAVNVGTLLVGRAPIRSRF
jgi:hypothetical protein